ncbi:MAG: DUF481 domain-containing protein [Calditrichia bacterium]
MTSFFQLFLLFILSISFFAELFGQVNTERLRKREAAPGFAGKAGVGFTLLSGNTEFFKIDTDLRLDYSRKAFYSFAVGNYQRGIRKEADFINKGFLHWRVMQDFSRRTTGELFVQKAFNDFTDLRSRNLIGGGGRLNLFLQRVKDSQEVRFECYLGVGLMWEEETIESSGVIRQQFRSTNYVSIYAKMDPNFQFSAITYLQTALQDRSDSRILSQVILRVGIADRVDLRALMGLNYDARPPDGVKKHDLVLTNGLEFRLN